jgi:hypothetical protein
MSNTLVTGGLLGIGNSLVSGGVSGSSGDMTGPVACIGGDALDLMVRLVAESATVQSTFGVGTPALVIPMLEKFQIFDEPDDELPDASPAEQAAIHTAPRAVINPIETNYRRDGPGEITRTGTTEIAFEIPIPAEHLADDAVDTTVNIQTKFRNRQVFMMNTVGCIKDEMIAKSGLADASGNELATLRSIRVSRGPGEPEDDFPDDWMGFILEVDWY